MSTIAPSAVGKVRPRAAAALRKHLDRTRSLIDALRQRLDDGQPISPAANTAVLRQAFDGTISALGDAERGLERTSERTLDHSTSQLLADDGEPVVRLLCEFCGNPATHEVREAGGSTLVCESDKFKALSDDVEAVIAIAA